MTRGAWIIAGMAFVIVVGFSDELVAAPPDVDTGSMEYWEGSIAAQYIYDAYSGQGPIVDTGAMEYWEGQLPAGYLYETLEPTPTPTETPEPTETIRALGD